MAVDKGDKVFSRQPNMAARTGPRVQSRRRARANTDTVKLLMLGYKQELEREFTLFNSFGCNYAFLSTLTSLSGGYAIGLLFGGPVVMMWGWLVITLFNLSVGLSMAELASAYPTSGALYYWSYKLAPPRLRNLACWMTAWILTLGEASLCASSFYTFVHLLATAFEVSYGVSLSNIQVFGLLMGATIVIGLLNCGSVRLTAYMTTLGTMWSIVGLVAFCVCVPLVAPARQSAEYIFTSWQPNTEITGIASKVYTALVGLLMSQWSIIGYEASAHLAEETFDAEYNVPRAILLTISGLGVAGFAFLLALVSVKVDAMVLLDPSNETHGTNVVLQILVEIAKMYGSVNSGVALFSIPIVAGFFTSYQAIANNSRMLYAFARDNGIPFSSLAKRVHPRTKAPVYAVVYMLLLTNVLATPMCFNVYMVPAIGSFSVVGCCLAYSLPVLCKVVTGRRFFLRGPFFLGPRLSYANNIITLIWVFSMTVLFILPQFYPITLVNLNWSAPILGFVLLCSLGWFYFPKYGAHTWFIGPRANLGQFQDVLPSERARKAAEMEAAEAAAAVAAGNVARAAADATELLARVANGTCGSTAPVVGDHQSARSSRCSGGVSTSPVRAASGVPPADLTEPGTMLAGSAPPHGVDSSFTAAGARTPGNVSSPTSARPLVSRISSRRHSALALLYSCGSSQVPNVVPMLSGMGLREMIAGGSASGSGAGASMISCDGQHSGAEGRPGRERAARCMSSRRPHSPSRPDVWTGPMERGSGCSRERGSLLMRAIAGSSAGASLPAPLGSPLGYGANKGSEGLEFSDMSLRQSRARLRRASVSVLTLQGPSGAPGDTNTSASVPATAGGATTMTGEVSQLLNTELDAASRELGGSGGV